MSSDQSQTRGALQAVRVYPDMDEYMAALRLIVVGRPEATRSADSRAEDLVAFLKGRPLDLRLVVCARQNDLIVSSGMVIESPGRAGLVYAASSPASERFPDATSAALKELRLRAKDDSLALLQALVGPNEMYLEPLLDRAGYTFLAELIYMDRSISRVVDIHDSSAAQDLVFTPFSEENSHLFIQSLDESYSESLDCPGLNGLRKTEDVLAAHKAAGDFDPSRWWVVTRGDRTAGILLLSKVVGRPALEVVYMGVTPSMRGTGVGQALLARAVETCHQERVTCLTLAVDASNSPALKLYKRWGFKETMRRRAWISPLE